MIFVQALFNNNFTEIIFYSALESIITITTIITTNTITTIIIIIIIIPSLYK